MYEIWLGVNILYELAWMYAPLVCGVTIMLALGYGLAWQRGGQWRAALTRALTVASVTGLVSVLLLPTLTRSSLAEMGYWIDWLNLLLISAGVRVLCGLLVWPFAAMRQAGVCPLGKGAAAGRTEHRLAGTPLTPLAQGRSSCGARCFSPARCRPRPWARVPAACPPPVADWPARTASRTRRR